jgi:hypothetical protein
MTAFGQQPLSGIMIIMMVMVIDGDEEHNVCYFSLLITKECFSWNGQQPFKDEAQTAIFKDPVRTAL